MNGIEGIIRRLEEQRAAIDRALEALRGVVPGLTVAGTSVGAAFKASVNRRSEGQRKRWAAKKALGAPAPYAVLRKGTLTPEGRKRLALAMKRRWAVKRTAAQAKKRPGMAKAA